MKKTKLVQQNGCDFCGKVGYSASWISRHEKHCTMNPDRECGMCAIIGNNPPDLRKIVERIKAQTGPVLWRPDSCGFKMPYVDGHLPELADIRDEVEGCPACILAILRQTGLHHPPLLNEPFYYQKERAAFYEQLNAEMWKREQDAEREYLNRS